MNKFLADFYVASNKEIFLNMRLKRQFIHEQIELVIVSKMKTRNLGYIKRHGYAYAESVNKINKVTEKHMVEIALLETVNFFHLLRVSVTI